MRHAWNVFLAIFFAGVVSLILELSILREFTYVFGASSFSNAFIISLFLTGLAGGTYLGSWDKFRAKTPGSPALQFSFFQFLAIVFILLFYITKKYFVYICPHKGAVIIYFVASTLIPSLIAGLTYAVSVEILYDKGEKYIKYIYAFSTLGSVFGGISHGIFFVPFFGMKSTYIFAAVFAAAALLFMLPFTRRLLMLTTLIFVAAVVLIILSDRFTICHSFKNLLFTGNSQFGPVEIWQTESGAVDMRVNRVHQYFSYDWDTQRHRQWAETTLEIVDRPCNVLLLGYGSGVSSAAFLGSPLVKRVDTVENCLPVIEASREVFPGEYASVSRDPRSHIIIQDFRSYIRFTKIKYDIITLDHSIADPVYHGFFTTDFFDRLKDIMNPGGVIALLGLGISRNTTSSSFNYVYRNIDPDKEPGFRRGVNFLMMEKIGGKAAGNYEQVEKERFSGEPVYSDDDVQGMDLNEMGRVFRSRLSHFLSFRGRIAAMPR